MPQVERIAVTVDDDLLWSRIHQEPCHRHPAVLLYIVGIDAHHLASHRATISLEEPQTAGSQIHGFGKLWGNNPVLREAVGWAISSERTENADLLTYAQHDWRMLHRKTNGTADNFFPNGEYTQAALQP